MIYFRWSMENYPEYAKRLFDRAILDGLTEFFEVIIISENCDYSDVCGRYRPDIVLFESGNNGYQDPPLRITNTESFPEIPKIGLVRSDTFCASRTIFLSDMDRWGVETFFTYQTAIAEYLPEIADQVFIWPFFVNTDIYYDYGENKIIPILLTGNTDILQYEWRRRIRPVVSKSFQCLIMPHLDYAGGNASRVLYDEKFGRLLNASFFVPTCGAMNKIVVIKHLEIPACKACLVTEKTPALEAFGFVDMENCVFADEQDIVDKIAYLLDNPDVLQKITESGYELVRTRHTVKQRGQMREWFELNKTLKVGQKIVQSGWFDPLSVVDESSQITNKGLISCGTDRNLLRQGDECFRTENYDEAIALYKQCLEYVDYMPEPKLRLALCCLYKGDPLNAYFWLGQNIKMIESYNGLDPDPVEWGYFLIILLCLGEITQAVEFAKAFSHLHRVELDRARWVVFKVSDKHKEMEEILPYITRNKAGYRRSVHQLPSQDFEQAVQALCEIFKACSKGYLIEKVFGETKSII